MKSARSDALATEHHKLLKLFIGSMQRPVLGTLGATLLWKAQGEQQRLANGGPRLAEGWPSAHR